MLAQLEHITKSYGAELILSGVNATIDPGDRIGLIGENGAGKTTLLRILTGDLAPDGGQVRLASGLSIGYLKQNSGLESGKGILAEMRTAFAEALSARAQMKELEQRIAADPENKDLPREYSRAQAVFEAKGGWEIEVNIKKVLSGMGFADYDMAQPVDALSGGEKTRLALAKLLLLNPRLLVLDEPTNHLDMDTLAWLEGYLSAWRGAILVVSHDRYFLDKVTQKTWELEETELCVYKGGYTAFKAQKAERVAFQMKEYEKQQNEIASKTEYARRNITRASTSKMAKSRLKQVEHIEQSAVKKPKTRMQPPSFDFEFDKNPVNDVLEVENLCLRVGEERRTIVEDVSFEIKRAGKFGLVGANGTGKSTLLRQLVAKRLPPEVHWGKNTSVGYYDQENKDMDANHSALDELWKRFPSLPEQVARGMLGRVRLVGDEVFKRVGSLSGGERARLGLAILMAGRHNVLVLDEPTNHLDLQAREALEEALRNYKGTLLFVSHDRYFVNALATDIMEIECGALTHFKGGWDDYRAAKAAQPEKQPQAAEEKTAKPPTRKDERREAAQRRQRAGELEKRIAALEAEQAELEARIAANPADFEMLGTACARLEQVKAEHERAAEEWLGAVED